MRASKAISFGKTEQNFLNSNLKVVRPMNTITILFTMYTNEAAQGHQSCVRVAKNWAANLERFSA